MRSKLTKIVIVALLLFSIIGFLATNSKLFDKGTKNENSQENVGESKETMVSSIKSGDNIKEEDFYKEFRRLDTELFMSHQVGNIGDTIRFYNDCFENDEGWIQVESCEVIKEMSDELAQVINMHKGRGIDKGRVQYGEEGVALSSGNYSILKVTYKSSFVGVQNLPFRFCTTDFYLYSTNQKMIYGEGTLVPADNLEYVKLAQVIETYANSFIFKNQEENYFQILYLVPDRLIDEGGLYISKVQNDDYLSNAWKYNNSTYVIELNIGEE